MGSAGPTGKSRAHRRLRSWVGLPPRWLLRRFAHRLPLAQRLGVARGDVGIGRIGADARQDLPRARAFASFGEPHLDRYTLDVVEAERVRRTITLDERVVRRDGDLGEVYVNHGSEQLGIRNVDDRRGLERRTDALVRALDFERAGDHAAHVAQLPTSF